MRRARARRTRWCLAGLLLIAALAPIPGCSSVPNGPGGSVRDVRDRPEVKRPRSSGGRVTVAGAGLVFADTKAPRLSPEGLLTKYLARQSEGRRRSARELVRTWPDVALEVLRRFDYGDGDRATAASLAADYDRVTGSGDGWSRAVSALEPGGLDGKELYESLSELRGDLARGEFSRVAESSSPALDRDMPSAFRAEALRLRALGALASNRLKAARRSLDQALEATRGQPHVAAKLRLLRCETLRRLGRGASAERDWRQAIALGAAGLSAPGEHSGASGGLTDPGFWGLARELRPSDQSPDTPQRLPPVLREALVSIGQEPPGTPDRSRSGSAPSTTGTAPRPTLELALLELVASLHLRRAEGRSALPAAKQAEALCRRDQAEDAPIIRRLRLIQARSLLLLGESGPAKTLLVELGRDRESVVGRQALLVLGAQEVAAGKARVGIGLLSSALAGPGLPRIDRARGKADLGLALLIVGREERAEQSLGEAEQGFRIAGQACELLQLLQNRLRYAEFRGEGDAAARLTDRIRALEQG